MKKAAGAAGAILRGILWMGFGIQAVLGFLWMCCNIRSPREFAGDWGALYRWIQGITGGTVLSAIQLGIGFYAGYCFLQALCPGRGKWRLLGSLAFLTFPMAMQCHLSVAPYSLISSLFLLELAALIPGLRQKKDGEKPEERGADAFFRGLAGGGACWFLLTLLLPEYLLLGAIPMVLALLFALRDLIKKPRVLALAVLLLAAWGGITAGAGALAGDGKYLPDREAAAYALFHRAVWPTLWEDQVQWPEEVREATGDDMLWTASRRVDAPEEYFRPRMLERFGDEGAAGYYLELSKISWSLHKAWTVRQIAGDALGYCATPPILSLQLSGRGYDSCSGRNYEFMAIYAPRLTKCYVRYSGRWFVVMIGVSALLTVAALLEGSVRLSGTGLRILVLCLFWAGAVTAFYTLRRAGGMDYKASVGVNLLWLAGALSVFLLSKRRPGGNS
ncbi:MAG: hypothetical protein NC432_04805 [Roseburia sp.]|nr:hypothetical protein [Roseburia sp.]MCM1098627.1 hypothetical protein [Ruminococcus flavefaciens]